MDRCGSMADHNFIPNAIRNVQVPNLSSNFHSKNMNINVGDIQAAERDLSELNGGKGNEGRTLRSKELNNYT